jgi:glycerol uptake facilitator-like aquaporin
LFGGPFSGASLNPARTIGPAVVSGNYSYLILYFLVPPLGAVAGAYLYEYIKHGKMPEKTKESYGTLGKIE